MMENISEDASLAGETIDVYKRQRIFIRQIFIPCNFKAWLRNSWRICDGKLFPIRNLSLAFDAEFAPPLGVHFKCFFFSIHFTSKSPLYKIDFHAMYVHAMSIAYCYARYKSKLFICLLYTS